MHPYRLPEAPESFPVNALVAIPGTPLEANERVTVQELLRTIATARIVLPTCVFLLSLPSTHAFEHRASQGGSSAASVSPRSKDER